MAQSGEKYIKQESTFFEFDKKYSNKIDALTKTTKRKPS